MRRTMYGELVGRNWIYNYQFAKAVPTVWKGCRCLFDVSSTFIGLSEMAKNVGARVRVNLANLLSFNRTSLYDSIDAIVALNDYD